MKKNQPPCTKRCFSSFFIDIGEYRQVTALSSKNKLYLLDITTIDLCLPVFPWAKFRKTKGTIKLHVGLDADGYLPTFMSLTDGKGHESQWAKP